MSQSTTGILITPDGAVELARQMREAGVMRFVLTHERFSAVLLPPPPRKVDDVREQIAEMSPKQRQELLEEARREFNEDLYGASR